MAIWTIEFGCGHTHDKELHGPESSQEWFAEMLTTKPCDECWKKEGKEKKQQEYDKENKESIEWAQQRELPNLNGSEKQIPYANTMRKKLIVNIESHLNGWVALYGEKVHAALCKIYEETTAKWWIDTKIEHVEQFVKDFDVESAFCVDDTIIYPDAPISNTIADIRYVKSSDNPLTYLLNVDFPEINDHFKEVIHNLLMYWNKEKHVWHRYVDDMAGTIEDRVAEVGNALLGNGFVVKIEDALIREKAINGDFEDEVTRWIFAKMSRFYIRWGK